MVGADRFAGAFGVQFSEQAFQSGIDSLEQGLFRRPGIIYVCVNSTDSLLKS